MRVHKATINREAQLLDPVAKYARKKGFSVQVPELPFFEYRIDLFGLSKPTGDTIAVELKMALSRNSTGFNNAALIH